MDDVGYRTPPIDRPAQDPALLSAGSTLPAGQAAKPLDDPAETAWRTCTRMRTAALAAQPLALLSAALGHATQLGLAGNARTMDEAMQPERLLAAKLFTHLLWRLGQPLTWTELHTVKRLLAVLPRAWGDSAAERLRRGILTAGGAECCSVVEHVKV